MKLDKFLEDAKLNYSQFAELIEVSPSAVQRYANDKRIPDKDVMLRIAKATAGLVTANDFFGIAA